MDAVPAPPSQKFEGTSACERRLCEDNATIAAQFEEIAAEFVDVEVRMEERFSEIQVSLFNELKLSSQAVIADVVAQHFAESVLEQRCHGSASSEAHCTDMLGSVHEEPCAELSPESDKFLDERFDSAATGGADRKREAASEEAMARLAEAAMCYEQRLCEVATRAETGLAIVEAKLNDVQARVEKANLPRRAGTANHRCLDEPPVEGTVKQVVGGLSFEGGESENRCSELAARFHGEHECLERRVVILERKVDNRRGVAQRRFVVDPPSINLPREQSTPFYSLQSL